MTPSAPLEQFIRNVVAQGKALVDASNQERRKFREHLRQAKNGWAEALFGLLENADVLKTLEPGFEKVQWVDLFHAPYDWNRTTRGEGLLSYWPGGTPESNAAKVFDWFSKDENFFSLTPRVFAAGDLNTPLILQNGPIQPPRADIKAIDIAPFISALSEEFGGEVFDAGKVRAKIDNLLSISGKLPSLGPNVKAYLESVPSDLDVEKGFLNFLVLAFFTDRDEFRDSSTSPLFYIYLPALSGAKRVVSGTVVALKAAATPSLEALLRLDGIANLWARYALLAEERHALMVRATTAARAAVFARNFSHVIGSHVVSNPRFRQALVGAGIELSRLQVEKSRLGFEASLEDYLRRGFEEDPEKFWNEGRLTLRGVAEDLKDGGALAESSRTFHEYLQGRFDFIARAIDDTKDRPEPIYFVADLLEGFLKQSAFLDTFVADLGLRLPDLRIELKLEERAFRVQWKRQEAAESADRGAWTHTWEPSPMPHDVLVGLPGGMVSAHAFYSLLENVIRNALKYVEIRRKRRDGSLEPYELKLVLKRAVQNDSAWCLQIRDNFSRRFNQVDDWMKPEFIDQDGVPRRHALGLLEMQACAMSLKVASGTNLKAVGGESLVYEIELQKPVLLALVLRRKETAEAGVEAGGVQGYESLEELATKGRGAHLAVVNAALCTNWVEEVSRYRASLPYRLLILQENGTDNEDWRAEVGRRVQVCHNSALRKRAFEEADLGDPHQLILDCYEEWLRAWKRKESPTVDSWHLWIGLERSQEQVREAWEKALEEYSTYRNTENQGFVHVAVQAFQRGAPSVTPVTSKGHQAAGGHFDGDAYWNGKDENNLGELKKKRSEKCCLVFDNHGQCFRDVWKATQLGDYEKSTRFYQKLSGGESPDLFRFLSHPPSAQFAFAFFIYGLVEACLANVAIVDERLAANLLFPSGSPAAVNDRFREHLGEHQKAGVFPVFCLKGSDGDRISYTDSHIEALRKALPENALAREGLTLFNDHATLDVVIPDDACRLDSVSCDALVIHEGALDLIGKRINWPGNEGAGGKPLENLMAHLLKLAPAVIRMSGRGRHTKHFPPSTPFIEFSEVSSALLTSRNKFALVRGLFGTSGETT